MQKDDVIYRQAAINVFGDVHPLDHNAQAYLSKIKALPSAEPEIIRCNNQYCIQSGGDICDRVHCPIGQKGGKL